MFNSFVAAVIMKRVFIVYRPYRPGHTVVIDDRRINWI